MYTIKIYDNKGGIILGKLSPNASAVEHFAMCARLAVDLANGGSELVSRLNEMVSLINPVEIMDTKTIALPGVFVRFFMGTLQTSAFFKPEEVMVNPRDPNFQHYQNIIKIAELPIDNTSAINVFFNIITLFKIPGIEKIDIQSDSSKNQLRLEAINFPEELIPENHKCQLSQEVMTKPCSDPVNSDVVIDYSVFCRVLGKNGNKNPYTNTPLRPDQLVVSAELMSNIDLFVQKAEYLFQFFQDKQRYDRKYKQHIELLMDHRMSLEEFTSTVTFSQKAPVGSFFHAKPAESQVPAEILNLFRDCKMPEISQPTVADYEKLMRRIAASGNESDLKKLLDFKSIDLNARDPKNGLTAVHWVVKQANSSLPEHADKYKACYDLLLLRGASLDILDNCDGKTRKPLDYDEKRIMPTARHHSPASV